MSTGAEVPDVIHHAKPGSSGVLVMPLIPTRRPIVQVWLRPASNTPTVTPAMRTLAIRHKLSRLQRTVGDQFRGRRCSVALGHVATSTSLGLEARSVIDSATGSQHSFSGFQK